MWAQLSYLLVDKVEGGEPGLVLEANVGLMSDQQVHPLRVTI
jgi:hypothetical protein